MNSAVIFDVDGVLLRLTAAEEEVFFDALTPHVPAAGLSRDWNSYSTRNDDDIIAEILLKAGKPLDLRDEIKPRYLDLLRQHIATGAVRTDIIPGTDHLLAGLAGQGHRLGIATANLLGAARLRLEDAGLWSRVSSLACGADGGGHKRLILARAIAATGLAKNRIVYVGDNLNDVEAGLDNGVHFIGFSEDPQRRKTLKAGGARNLAADHAETARLIAELLHG